MTPLKFRAFKNGKMYPVHTLDFNDDGTVGGYSHVNGECIDLEGAVFEQWTGLRDKNGKEIFEGDLVAEINSINDLPEWGEPLRVEFGEFVGDKDSWGISYATTGFLLRYEDGELTGLHTSESHYGFNSGALLIVGNIHEPIIEEVKP